MRSTSRGRPSPIEVAGGVNEPHIRPTQPLCQYGVPWSTRSRTRLDAGRGAQLSVDQLSFEVGEARKLIEELTVIDAKIRAADKHLRQLVATTDSTVADLNGIGPSGAARLLGDIGDAHRFATAAHFASWNGTAPLEASSGDQRRHRLSCVNICRENVALLKAVWAELSKS